jgi:phosphopantothenoylcysteine decarboxylase/phosphopantothenate--cysteine ligase
VATSALDGKRILLGVSGGIAAYKAADLVRRLRENGAEVRVVMTAGAEHFVTPLTFQALSGQPVRSGLWDEAAEAAMGHIELARWAQLILIAPASADVIARLAAGLAGDLLTTICLASSAPLALAPAMNQQMWAHPATQANLDTLRARNVRVLGPASGSQACGEFGSGRMLDAVELAAAAAGAFAPQLLKGVRALVSAGPTFEDLDPVRFIGNRSSGKMGFAVAQAAAEAGAAVTLIAGPVSLATPPGVTRIDVRSAADMRAAVLAQVPSHALFVSAAAVADYRPDAPARSKIKKSTAPEGFELKLTPTIDILAEVSTLPQRPFLVGFAAETDKLAEYARGKLERKKLDLVCANRVGAPGCGFDAAENEMLVLWPGGEREIARASKAQIARELVALIAERMAAREATA